MNANDSIKRYSRQIILKEVGGQGQKLLMKSKVLIIGLGGLGSPVLQYLAASGVGTIGLADNDKVDLSNLHRQIIFSLKDIGSYKVSKAKKFISAVNSDINVIPYKQKVDLLNVDKIISKYDIIVDCTDNHSSKLIINDACYRSKKTLVYASVSGFFGQVSTFKSFKIDGTGNPYPSYRCLKINQNNEDDCEHLGVLGPIAGVLGSIQATEVIKQILGEKENLLGQLLIFDGLSYRMKLIKINWDQNNPLNGKS